MTSETRHKFHVHFRRGIFRARKKSGRPGQVVFGFEQVTFLASLPDRQGYGQATALNGFKKACEK